MDTNEKITNDIIHAYTMANKRYDRGYVALSKLWELSAAYLTESLYGIEVLPTVDYYFADSVGKIDSLIYNSDPKNISHFGYHGDTPIGVTWGIVTSIAPNIAEIIDESNWECFIKEMKTLETLTEEELYTIERFASWASPTENLMVKLIDDNGYPTIAAIKVLELLNRLADYPLLDEDDYSQRESDSDYQGNIDSIRSAMNSVMLIDETPDNDTGIVWEWLYENDPQAIESASSGYSGAGGYIADEPIYVALYCLGWIDLSAYDENELADFESELLDYTMRDFNRALRTIRL